ncbi:MAG: hypothetical protein P4M08_04675 [Oligoflexia bacterium]|nr:hypothetical protein [Oligoflexia bacterium]
MRKRKNKASCLLLAAAFPLIGSVAAAQSQTVLPNLCGPVECSSLPLGSSELGHGLTTSTATTTSTMNTSQNSANNTTASGAVTALSSSTTYGTASNGATISANVAALLGFENDPYLTQGLSSPSASTVTGVPQSQSSINSALTFANLGI